MDSELSWLSKYAPKLIGPLLCFVLAMVIASLGDALLRDPEKAARHPVARLWSWVRLRLTPSLSRTQTTRSEPASPELSATRGCRYHLLGGALCAAAAGWLVLETSGTSYLDYSIRQSMRPRAAVEVAVFLLVMGLLQWYEGAKIARRVPVRGAESGVGPGENMRDPVVWASSLCWLAGLSLGRGVETLLQLVVGTLAR